MKQIILLISFVFVCCQITNAQTNDSIEDRNEALKIGALPYYSYRSGIGMTSPDSIYQLNIRFRIQNRVTFSDFDKEERSIDAQIRRLRLRFDGYVGSSKFTYAIQLGFASGDVGTLQDGGVINIIRDAVVYYQPNNKWSFGFGQTKLPGNRQRLNSSGALQLTDRSINNANFTIDRDFGLQIHRNNMYRDKFSYNFKLAISQGEGRNVMNNKDAGLAYTGKIEVFPFGSFQKSGEYFEGDLKRETTPKLMISTAYQFNHQAQKSQGQLGSTLFEKRDLHAYFADVIFKYRGVGLMGAFMGRHTENPLTFDANNSSNMRYVYAGYGWDFQSSYQFKNSYEIIGRYSNQVVDKKIFEYTPNMQQYTVGLTKYIWEHAFKLQTELTYQTSDFFNNTQKNSWYFRFQIEMGI